MIDYRANWFLRYHYRIALPLIWVVVTNVSWKHPGDEYGLFFVGALPGVWLMFLFNFGHLPTAFWLTLIGGLPPMFLLGWLLDRVRVPRSAWFTVFGLLSAGLVAWSLAQFPSYSRAMSKNGSIAAYVAASMNMSLWLSVLPLAGLTPLIRAVRSRWKGSGPVDDNCS